MSISFDYNREKAHQIATWFIQQHGGRVNKLKLVKLIFYADQMHLFKYTRPIAGGQYYNMQHGPVCSELLNEIDISPAGSELSLDPDDQYMVVSNTKYNEVLLSESDLEIIGEVNKAYGNLDKYTLRDLTHTLKAWKNSFREDSENKRVPLSYEDFFLDTDNPDMLEVIKENQEIGRMFA